MVRALLLVMALMIAGAGNASAQGSKSRPAWAELTAEQQEILAPLRADWEQLEPKRRRKWIGIAKRYPAMTPQEQHRVQKRMQAWVKLTPEQREQARENYKRIAKERREKRESLREQWAEYQALPPSERQRLAPESTKPEAKKTRKKKEK